MFQKSSTIFLPSWLQFSIHYVSYALSIDKFMSDSLR